MKLTAHEVGTLVAQLCETNGLKVLGTIADDNSQACIVHNCTQKDAFIMAKQFTEQLDEDIFRPFADGVTNVLRDRGYAKSVKNEIFNAVPDKHQSN
jgi:hypothetical protein